jgi:hypothetical protein
MQVQKNRVDFNVNLLKQKDRIYGLYPLSTRVLSIQDDGEKVGGFCRIKKYSDPLPDPKTIQFKDDQMLCPPDTHTCQIDFSQHKLSPGQLIFINESDQNEC